MKRGTCGAYVVGFDPALGEDMTCEVLAERQADGTYRVLGVRTWTMRPTKDGSSNVLHAQHHDLIMKGWKCTACGRFNGEEKEEQAQCTSCEHRRANGIR